MIKGSIVNCTDTDVKLVKSSNCQNSRHSLWNSGLVNCKRWSCLFRLRSCSPCEQDLVFEFRFGLVERVQHRRLRPRPKTQRPARRPKKLEAPVWDREDHEINNMFFLLGYFHGWLRFVNVNCAHRKLYSFIFGLINIYVRLENIVKWLLP